MAVTYIGRVAPCLLGCLITTSVHAQAVVTTPPPSQSEYDRSVACMATAIAYEAGYEPIEGQQAVGEVILNRVRLSGFSKSVCDIVYAGSKRSTGCQFTFACDGALRRKLPDRVMIASRLVAEGEMTGINPVRAFGASHYHADYVNPYWASSLVRITKIGAHIFYRAANAPEISGKPLFPYGVAGSQTVADVPSANIVEVSSRSAKGSRVFAPWGLTALANRP